MARVYLRALLSGVALLAAGLLWLEVLVFRLSAVTVGHGVGYLVTVLGPCAAALGAVAFAAGDRVRSPAVERRASILAVLTTASWLAALLALTWLSHKLAHHRADVSVLTATVLATTWLLPFFFGGSTLGVAVRCAWPRMGTVGYFAACGAVLACLLLPAGMWVGAPRMALIGAWLPALAALAFAVAARRAGAGAAGYRPPPWTVVVTGPLIVMTLLAGDIGAPWLHIRSETTRRAKQAFEVWSTEGFISVRRKRGINLRMSIDGGRDISLVRAGVGKPRIDPAAPDVGYGGLPGAARGAFLIIGSGGGREVQFALIKRPRRLDVVERSSAVVNTVLRDRFEAHTGGLFTTVDGVRLQLGDGRAQVAGIDGPFDRVVVVDAERFVHVPPRLIAWSERLYTRAALRSYLDRLAPGGAVVLVRPTRDLDPLVSVALDALGMAAGEGPAHLRACESAEGEVALLVRSQTISAQERRRLGSNCKKKQLTVREDVGAAPAAEADTSAAATAQPVDGALGTGPSGADPRHVATDDRPFLEPVPGVGQLALASVALLGELTSGEAAAPGPGAELPQPKRPRGKRGQAGKPAGAASSKAGKAHKPSQGAKPKQRGKASARRDGAASEPAVPTSVLSSQVVVIGLTACVALLLALLTVALGLGRALTVARQQALARGAVATLALAGFGYGAALALAQLAIVDRLVVLLGHASYGWLFAIPLGLAGAGGGRLLVDSVQRRVLRRAVAGAGATTIVLLVALYALAPGLESLWASSLSVRLAAAALVAVAGGALLGGPLAATLRLLGDKHPALVGLGWGLHGAGWALGGAAGALLMRYGGVRSAWLYAAAVTAAAAAAVMLSGPGRRQREGRAPAAPPQPA